MVLIGIDVGGSSLKAAPVDTVTGELTAAPQSLPTPQPATPEAIAEAVRQLVVRFTVQGPVGVAFPSVFQNGVARTAANVDKSWIGTDGQTVLSRALGRPVVMLNDADAAGVAEMQLGAGRGRRGTVLMLTFGTGIGSALFVDGVLVPNTELGHLYMTHRKGSSEAEEYASGRARSVERLDWPTWAARANEVLDAYHRLLWPELFILGGGLTESYQEFAHLLESPAEIVPARFLAHAGIVGAAMAAASRSLYAGPA